MSLTYLHQSPLNTASEPTTAWEKAYIELQVIVACCDGELASSERTALSLLCLSSRNERDNRRWVQEVLNSIEQKGFQATSQWVIDTLRQLLLEINEPERSQLAQEILHNSIPMVIADDRITREERSFFLERLAPQLGLVPEHAEGLLAQATEQLGRARMYLEHAFEVTLMLTDLAEPILSLNAPPEREVGGFLGAVDSLVASQRLASSRLTAYFLEGIGGVFWTDNYQEHCTVLTRLITVCRQNRKNLGPKGRLDAIHAQLQELVDSGADPNAFWAVQRHLTNALSRLRELTDVQRQFFRTELSPALEIDFTQLLERASQRKSMTELHRNLIGSGQSEPLGAPKRWWEFWK